MRKITRLIYSVYFIVLTACQQSDYVPTRLSKRALTRVNKAIFEIVVPKKEDKRVIYERDLPWSQLPFKERTDKYHSIGTAFFVDEKHLVSAAHVFSLDEFSTWQEFYVRNSEGKVYAINDFKKYSQYRDFVEFDLKEYPQRVYPLKINEKVEIGDTVFAIGNAQGEGISVRGGQVASFTPEHVAGKWNYIRFSSPASPGNSGGPLVNIHAEVVGLIVMKNESENYNYALPIDERNKISNKEATFFEHNVTVFDGTQAEVEDWKEEHPLPANTKKLASFSQTEKNSFYAYLLEKLKKTQGDKLFPKHEMFREYLYDQSLGKFFGAIQNNTSLREWDVEHVNMKKIRIAPHQFLHLGKGKLGHYEVLIERPKDMPLKKFLENPQLQFEQLVTGMGLTRTIGKERIRILSFGAPDLTDKWQDELGRKWTSSYWFVTYNDIMYSLDCLAAPKGVLCLFDAQTSSQYSSGYKHFKSYNVLEQPASLFGTFKEWKEYFALGEKYLPESFLLKKFNFDEKRLVLAFNDLELKADNLSLSSDSILTIYSGYNLQNPIGPSIEAISVQIDENEYEGLSVKRTHRPTETSDKEHIKRWKKIDSNKSPYNGNVYESEDIFYSKRTLLKTKQSVYVLSCFSEKEEMKKVLKKRCLKQVDNVKRVSHE